MDKSHDMHKFANNKSEFQLSVETNFSFAFVLLLLRSVIG